MIPLTDRAIEAAKRITSNKPDDAVCLIEAGVLLALIAAAEDHAHCETDADDALADLMRAHEAKLGQMEDASSDLVAAVEPFEAFAKLLHPSIPDKHAMTNGSSLAARQITVGDFRRLQAALSNLKEATNG